MSTRSKSTFYSIRHSKSERFVERSTHWESTRWGSTRHDQKLRVFWKEYSLREYVIRSKVESSLEEYSLREHSLRKYSSWSKVESLLGGVLVEEVRHTIKSWEFIERSTRWESTSYDQKLRVHWRKYSLRKHSSQELSTFDRESCESTFYQTRHSKSENSLEVLVEKRSFERFKFSHLTNC